MGSAQREMQDRYLVFYLRPLFVWVPTFEKRHGQCIRLCVGCGGRAREVERKMLLIVL
jgi:hypothetical protein